MRLGRNQRQYGVMHALNIWTLKTLF